MDGWESRRRRTSGHDFCVVKLGIPGVIRGVDVETTHFKGNYPEAGALDAASSADGPWSEVLPRSALRGDAHNLFPVRDGRRFTHVRLRVYPDGGVARLRVHGEAAPDWSALSSPKEPVDLAALANGGLVLAFSDAFFGSYQNLLMPGRGAGMHDGWETKRSRRPGFDWVIVRLGSRGAITEALVDTNHFKGNFPAACALEVCDAPGAETEALTDAARAWRPLLPESPLSAHAEHRFAKELLAAGPATHARLRIFPDGGVSRLRLFGRPALPEPLARLNAASSADAEAALLRCCGARRWAVGVATARPFDSHLELFAAGENAFDGLGESDWLEALRAHPKIGDRAALAARFAGTAAWAEGEQSGAREAPDEVLDALAKGNTEYDARFGFPFVVCATGQAAFRMLASLHERLPNPRDIELGIAADEQRRITRLRIGKLLTESP